MKIKIYFLLIIISFLGCKKEQDGELINIQQPNLAVPELLFPQNNQQFFNLNYVAFRWNYIVSGEKYQLLVATDSSFQTILVNSTISSSSNLPVQFIYGDLQSPKIRGKLYWKVNAIDSLGNVSNFSKVYTAVFLTNQDFSPEITAESLNLKVMDPTQFIPTINWNPMVGAVNYEVCGSYSYGFVDKLNEQNIILPNYEFNQIKLITQKECFFKPVLFQMRWDDTLQFIVRAKFVDGSYSKWSLSYVIIKDPQIDLFTGNYQVKMQFSNDTTIYNELVTITKYGRIGIKVSIPKYNIGVYYGAMAFYPDYGPHRVGLYSAINTNTGGPSYFNFDTINGKFTIKGSGEDFYILSGYKF